MNIEVLYHDEYYLIVKKPPNLLVHPYWKETNEKESLFKYVKEQTGLYLYPIHRLDRQVSGIVVFGLTSEATRELQKVWHCEDVKKMYTALVWGEVDQKGEMTFALNNDNKTLQEAHTLYKKIKSYPLYSLVEIEIKTGRKHQIRRHFSRRCHHIIGDRKYGKKRINDPARDNYAINRVFLHSHLFQFKHPFIDKLIVIKCPLHHDLEQSLKILNCQEIKKQL